MGVNRRDIIAAGSGAGLGLVGGAAAGYFGRGLLSGERDDVTGFVWSDRDYPPFRDEELRQSSPHYEGTGLVSFNRYDSSPTVAVVGALATDIMSGLNEGPRKQLGVAYTDPGGNWHQGYGLPGQLFGGVIPGKDGPVVAAALGVGRGDVEFSWVFRGEDGLVTPLRSLAVGGIAMPREDVMQQYPGVPAL